jgi:hypothetical protein
MPQPSNHLIDSNSPCVGQRGRRVLLYSPLFWSRPSSRWLEGPIRVGFSTLAPHDVLESAPHAASRASWFSQGSGLAMPAVNLRATMRPIAKRSPARSMHTPKC